VIINIYLDDINNNVIGIPVLINYTVSTTSFVGFQDFTSPENIFIDVGPTYVYVYGMTLPNNGLIYVMIGNYNLLSIGNRNIWSRDPLISEIKIGSGPNGQSVVGY
jgi:hypothetical protein